MDPLAILLLASIIFLLIAVIGGGFAVKEIKIPIVPKWARIVSGFLGIAFFALYIFSSIPHKTLKAAFHFTPSSGPAPLTVAFNDVSDGSITTRIWDFGDGNSITTQNPSHTYTTSGRYTVSLTVSSSNGSDKKIKSNCITVMQQSDPAPSASFHFTPGSGHIPLAATFTDTSSGNIAAWNWNFGDGHTSTAQHPSHTYTAPGRYTVSLTVRNSTGSDKETKIECITSDNVDVKANEDWLWGDYNAAINDFAIVLQKSDDPMARRLAERRLRWLEPYRGRIIFADDFHDDTIGTGARWTLRPPGAGTGSGAISRTQEGDNFVLEGSGHYHAWAKMNDGTISRDFEIQLRFRPLNLLKDGVHINIMMDKVEGRLTLGLYMRENIISMLENKGSGSQNTRIEHQHSFGPGWHKLRIVVEMQRAYVFVDERLVVDYKSPRSRIVLKGFNIEPLYGALRFDDVLIVTR